MNGDEGIFLLQRVV